MSRFATTLIGNFQIGRWSATVAVAACLVLSGCAYVGQFRGEPFHDNDLSELARYMRADGDLGQSSIYSNRARQPDSMVYSN